VELVRAPFLPGPQCIGGRPAWATLQLVLDTLSSCKALDVRSGEVSALAALTEPRQVPEEVENPFTWVESFVLPQKAASPHEPQEKAHRPKREQLGFRFFQQYQVDPFVRRKLRPEHLFAQKEQERLPQVSRDISHYVTGASELLLMEPIIGTRPQLTDDLKRISESFLAYRALFEMAPTAYKPHFLVYVLAGGYEGAMAEAHNILKKAAHQVINVDDPAQRTPFLQRIVAVGRTGGGQDTLALH
jgi:hypothetical protein